MCDAPPKNPQAPQPEPSAKAVADLRRRLHKQAPLTLPSPPAGKGSAPLAPIVFRRDLPRTEHAPAPARPSGRPLPLAEALSGVEIVAPNGSRTYLVEERAIVQNLAATIRTGAAVELSAALGQALENPASALRGLLRELALTEPPRLEDLLFLDLETTGLGSSPLFLIGTLACDAAGLALRQFFARDYAEESAALLCFLERAAQHKLLVTFNGKSFDVPYLRMRAAAAGVPCRLAHLHLDLLHAARRIWKDRFGDCRLQTLEYHVCGRRRHDDIPGAEIAEAYHAYVRSGDARQMRAVLSHNRRDLLTLAEILVQMPVPRADDLLGGL